MSPAVVATSCRSDVVLTWNRGGDKNTPATKSGNKKKNMSTGKTSGTDFSKIFLDLATTKVLVRNKFASTKLKSKFDYKSQTQYCLELADVVTTDDERAAMFGDDCDVRASTSKDIVLKMEQKIAEWNGVTWKTELDLRKKGISKKGDGVTGLSTEIKAYKKKCILKRGKTLWINGKGDIKYPDQPLVDLYTIEDETVRPVVPKNTIMTNFFASNKKRDDADSDDDNDDDDNDAGETERSNDTIDSPFYQID